MERLGSRGTIWCNIRARMDKKRETTPSESQSKPLMEMTWTQGFIAVGLRV